MQAVGKKIPKQHTGLALALSTTLIETLLFSCSSLYFHIFTAKIYGSEMESGKLIWVTFNFSRTSESIIKALNP